MKKVKKIKTNIRPFISDDIGLMWDQCKMGNLPLPMNTAPEEFHANLKQTIARYHTHFIVEDDGEPIAAMFVKTDGWLVEPHVEFFAGTTPAAIFRSYLHFFGSLVKQGIQGTCVIKAFKENRKLFDKLVSKGVLHYVGEVPYGDPKGTVYQYCLLHKRSQS